MNCIYCGQETDLENGDVEGYIGSLEIAFCIDCYPVVVCWIFHKEGIIKEEE
tara:strand:- start:1101 stop:1256 length:156 start_codon:yes stop_codon:yes gene_type:complete